MYLHATDHWWRHNIYWLILCFVTTELKKYGAVCTSLSVFLWITVRLMICTCPQWELHRTLPLKARYTARICLLDQQGIRNSWCDSILGSLVRSCSISISSSTSKRENYSSMVHKTGELESAPGFFCPFVEAAIGRFAYPFYIVHFFSALTIYKHFPSESHEFFVLGVGGCLTYISYSGRFALFALLYDLERALRGNNSAFLECLAWVTSSSSNLSLYGNTEPVISYFPRVKRVTMRLIESNCFLLFLASSIVSLPHEPTNKPYFKK